jgi:deoxyhypusine synthase
MHKRHLHDGREDKLVPLKSLDLDEVDSFSSLLRGMSHTAFSGRSLGEAVDVLEAMAKDPDCLIVVTLSGAMTVAKMGMVLIRMIEAGLVHASISTGALMAHGLSEAVGLTHYKLQPERLRRGVLREGLQPRLRHARDGVEPQPHRRVRRRGELDKLDPEKPWSSEHDLPPLGKALADMGDSPGILRSAYLHGVPGVRPRASPTASSASTSRRGCCVARTRSTANQDADFDPFKHAVPPPYNPFHDLISYAKLVRTKEAPRHLHDRRRRAAQLGAAGRARSTTSWGTASASSSSTRASLRRAHLPRARALGRPVRLHVFRGRELGQVRLPQGGRQVRRGVRGRDVAWPLLIKGVLEELGRK